MKHPHRVAIVVDPSFGERLESLAKQMHVWIWDSPENRRAAEKVWAVIGRANVDPDSGVTIFDGSDQRSPAELLEQVLDTVDLHHGSYSQDSPWTVITAYGCPPSPTVVQALAELGAEIEESDGQRFVAVRAAPVLDDEDDVNVESVPTLGA